MVREVRRREMQGPTRADFVVFGILVLVIVLLIWSAVHVVPEAIQWVGEFLTLNGVKIP